MTYIPAIVVLLLTLGDIQCGEANFFGFGRIRDASVSRDDSPVIFWIAILIELSIAAGLAFAGRYIAVEMANG